MRKSFVLLDKTTGRKKIVFIEIGTHYNIGILLFRDNERHDSSTMAEIQALES